MTHVAREMERAGFALPLLIGGATTSKAHTAVKIAPAYHGPVVHVLDASRAVPVVGTLLNVAQKEGFTATLRTEYDGIRTRHSGTETRLLRIEDARQRAPTLRYDNLPQPEFIGARLRATDAPPITATPLVTPDVRRGTKPVSPPDPQPFSSAPHTSALSLSDLVPFIDWSPFFHAWELRGRYPAILNHERHGEQARQLFADAQRLLEQIVSNRLVNARGIYAFLPANSVGDDVEVYADTSRQQVLATFHFLRQQIVKPDNQPNYCLADFIAPKGPPSPGAQPPPPDHLGFFAVTTGHGLDQLVARFRSDHDDYQAIMAEALADRLAEAFAEYLHQRARQAWDYGRNEQLSIEQLIDEQYRGIRPAAGYPACPDHTHKRIVWDLLNVEQHTGIRLTESCAMWPGSSVSGFYFAHPDSKYFAVGKLNRDQILDYQRRTGSPLAEIERWLGPWLNYDPTATV
jgi:5-methyltetrahydrofolate--homocysteine methyltransferase